MASGPGVGSLLQGIADALSNFQMFFQIFSFCFDFWFLTTKNFDFIKKNKVSKLEKAFKNQPEVKAKIKKLNKLAAETEKVLKKYGIDKEIHKIN